MRKRWLFLLALTKENDDGLEAQNLLRGYRKLWSFELSRAEKFRTIVPKEKLRNENEDRGTMVRICKVDRRIRKFLKRKYRGFFWLKNYLCRTGDSFTLPKIYVSCDFHDTFSIDNEVLISLLSVNLLNIEFMWFRITLYVTSSLL